MNHMSIMRHLICSLSKESGTSIKTRNYTRPGYCMKTALPKATVTFPGPVNWGVVYPTVNTLAALEP